MFFSLSVGPLVSSLRRWAEGAGGYKGQFALPLRVDRSYGAAVVAGSMGIVSQIVATVSSVM